MMPLMEKTIEGQTAKGFAYNLTWPGDFQGGGAKPAIPPKKRAEFVGDVRGENEEGSALGIAELRKKWQKYMPSDRTLSKWCKWARGLAPIEPKQPEPEPQAEEQPARRRKSAGRLPSDA